MPTADLRAVPNLPPLPTPPPLVVRVYSAMDYPRARDALMYWEVGRDTSTLSFTVADVAEKDVRDALSIEGVVDYTIAPLKPTGEDCTHG